jgi:DNA-binding GntR family transcriptional regulator
VLFSQERTPVEYVKILYRGDRYQYFVHLKRQAIAENPR